MAGISFAQLMTSAIFWSVLAAPPVIANPSPTVVERAAVGSICGAPTAFTSCDSSDRSTTNCNPSVNGIFPVAAGSSDPAYQLSSEDSYRGAIHIPASFNRSKPAVILFPGTSLPTYDTYKDTLINLLQQDGLNPVWVNPGFQFTQFSTADAQLSAEFAAYAINYLYALTGQKNSILGASQGSMNVQWALKYWKSTRSKVSDFIAVSGDFKGTDIAGPPFVVETIERLAVLIYGEKKELTEAQYQQVAGGHFPTALNANGGDAALVPTTSIWSDTDEIISPHNGDPNKVSENLPGAGVGFTGVNVQALCKQHPSGNTNPPTGNYSHVGMLFHPLTYTLIKDAVTHDGPASLTRLSADIDRLCSINQVQDPRLPPTITSVPVSLGSLAGCFGSYIPSTFIGVTSETTVSAYATRAA